MATFVIPCKYSKEVPIIFNCLESIRKYHPDDEILIIDSNSDDKSYFEQAKKTFGAKVVDAGNNNYTTGAIWHVFENYKRDFYYFFHDSVELLENISHLEQKDISPLMYHYHWEWPMNKETKERNSNWAKGQIEGKTNLNFSENNFFILQGAIFCCKYEVLEKVKDTGFNNILPNNKYQEEVTERLWGFVLGELGYNQQIRDNSILGLTRQGQGIGSDFIKSYANGKSEVIYEGIRYFATNDGEYHIGKTDKCFVKGVNFRVKKNKYHLGDKVVKYWCSMKRR